jgi:uncharacterized protein
MSADSKKENKMPRRDFLKAAPVAAGMAFHAARASASPAVPVRAPAVAATALAVPSSHNKIEAFDYQGVTLRDSRWRTQMQTARDYYMAVSNDDILQGFRAAAGLPAPGKPLGGWCKTDTQMIFGQWLSGMSRMYCATGDQALLDKATYLMTEWGKTVKPGGDFRLDHYSWDKLMCGLIDMRLYGGQESAVPLMEMATDLAKKNLQQTDMVVLPNDNKIYYGKPAEWYTLAENLFRAYRLTGEAKYKDFAQVWLYHEYWNKFRNTSAANVTGVHAYSHVNTLSSAAMTYDVLGDPAYLEIIKNAYDFLQNTQCFATGGYGPNERFMAADGSLGRALETRADTFETLCGSWAAFKLARYLTQFTGESRYGDWVERLFYNGAGAALPLETAGRNFYYSDYRYTGGMKVYRWDNYTCCSGTLFQDVADYHNLIYYKDPSSLYINLYVPSEVRWQGPQGEVKLVQETTYPEGELVKMTLAMAAGQKFPLKFRVPDWSSGMTVSVNGADTGVPCEAGQWATVDRAWNSGDQVEVRIPMRLRYKPVDREHPKRVAIMRGPVVLAMDFDYHDPAFKLPSTDEDLNRLLIADASPALFRITRDDGRNIRLKMRPFYDFARDFPYLMYFDLGEWPYRLW